MAAKKRPSSDSLEDVNGSRSKKLKEQDKSIKQNEGLVQTDKFLKSINLHLVKAGIEKARLDIFKKQVTRFGGTLVENYDDHANTYVVVDDKMDATRLMRLLNLGSFPQSTVIKSAWLSSCFKQKKLADIGEYELKHVEKEPKQCDVSRNIVDNKSEESAPSPESSSSTLSSRRHDAPLSSQTQNPKTSTQGKAIPASTYRMNDSDYEPSDDDDNEGKLDATSHIMPTRKQVNVGGWICAQSSKNPKPNSNGHITSKLEVKLSDVKGFYFTSQEMVKAYESTNDKWRAFGYQKAIQALRRHPKEISSWEEAKSLPGIGGRLADKIWEIAQSGELRKLAEFKSSEEVRVLQTFNNVWGAGPHTAQLWYQQGFRTVQDLQEKANLNHQQKVGVRLFDDLNERMPREEAGQIEKMVREAAESLLPGVIAQACGSYRRGKLTCGDVDVLVTHPDGRSHQGIFGKLLAKLKENAFLTDDLVTAEDSGNQKKYLGVCKLPGADTKHRRLDIIVVPFSEYACALVYFTGSAHFNRSLRHLCKKQNMSLNEHALKTGVVRKGTEKIHEGTIIPTPKEEDVFTALNVPYRPPEERDH